MVMRFAMRFLAIILGSVALAACGGANNPQQEYVERSVNVIYNNAYEELQRGNYIVAAQEFDEVERQHPYSIWARRAMVMSAYTYYIQNRYDLAVATAQRFLALYPGNQQAPYAYYLIAMCQYERISDIRRDQLTTELARAAILDVLRRYPDSGYAQDLWLKLDLVTDNLAGKEMDVGRFYLNRGEYGAAANRFALVIRNFPTSAHVPEALHRLTEVYLSLGIKQDAQVAAAVLGYNYPDNAWYRDSYRILVQRDLQPKADKQSWISRALNTVF